MSELAALENLLDVHLKAQETILKLSADNHESSIARLERSTELIIDNISKLTHTVTVVGERSLACLERYERFEVKVDENNKKFEAKLTKLDDKVDQNTKDMSKLITLEQAKKDRSRELYLMAGLIFSVLSLAGLTLVKK